MSGTINSTETVLRLRSVRNRMIDLLRLGDTYPVRDLPVPIEQLMVAYNDTAKISVGNSEKDVAYTLRDKDDHPVGEPVTGIGSTVTLTTPAIQDVITYAVHAKTPAVRYADNVYAQREANLLETATVNVGLNLALDAVVLPQPGPTPRMLDFNSAATVQVPSSQNGVDYLLVWFPSAAPLHQKDMAAATQGDGGSDGEQIVSDGDRPVRGIGGSIQLPSKPLRDDTVLRIRATKVFDPALKRPPETNILTVRLSVFVRADPGLVVSSDPQPIFDFQATPFARVAAAQAGVDYRPVLLRVADAAFAQGSVVGPDIIAVPVPGQPDALIRLPSLAGTGALEVPPGFTVGADWQAGAGADLRLALPPAGADTIVAVAARKTHHADSGPFVSSVWLAQRIAQLVRPNPMPALMLSVTVSGAGTDGALTVAGGQSGVFYTPRIAPAGAPILPPAYMHQRNAEDQTTYKGIGQLKLEVDFAVAREGQPPLPPVLATDAIPVGTTLTIQAMVAQSRVAIDLPAQPVIAPIPSMQVTPELVDLGGTTHVQVQASLATDTYALFQEAVPDVPIGPPQDGNGQTLDFAAPGQTQDTLLVLATTSKGPIPVRRRGRLNVFVRPNPSLVVRPRDVEMAVRSVTAILVEASEPNVSYQVVAAGAPVGSALPGTGATLSLPVGPLTTTTAFSVVAARLLPPAVSVTLTQTATVTVKPS